MRNAQIVKSQEGYWVGKEIHRGESYISFDPVRFYHPVEKITEVDFATLQSDIETLLNVNISESIGKKTLEVLSVELCNSSLGMAYCLDWKSPFGVRKIYDPPIQ